MQTGREHAAQTYSMEMQQGCVALNERAGTHSMDMKHVYMFQGHAQETCRIEKQRLHAAWTYIRDMRLGYAVKKCSKDMQYTVWTCSMNMLYENVTQTCSMDMQRGYAASTCSVNMRHGHAA
jgi:hypothetical protein